jgi:hypothetical protein
MIQGKFIDVIGFSAVHTTASKVFFDGSSPEPFSLRRCHGY